MPLGVIALGIICMQVELGNLIKSHAVTLKGRLYQVHLKEGACTPPTPHPKPFMYARMYVHTYVPIDHQVYLLPYSLLMQILPENTGTHVPMHIHVPLDETHSRYENRKLAMCDLSKEATMWIVH